MTERRRDWDVITGWEKRIKVDFGSIGPNHVRWSDWTHKERDIVARKVHESTLISNAHGVGSNRMEDWARENAPIMIDFARDGGQMPDWAHADYRPSGVPEYVKVVWQRKDPDDMMSPADWAYDPPGPWDEAGEEPAWSARPKDPEYTGSMHSDYGGVISYRTAANGDYIATDGRVISTAESRAKEDVPRWRKFELRRIEDVDGHIVPGPNALPKDIEQYGDNVKLTKRHKIQQVKTPGKIMPDDPNHTPLEKALNWASETHHGLLHQDRWNKVAAALGADNGFPPMPLAEAEDTWKRFGKNPRWTMALNAIEEMGKDDLIAANRYREAVGLSPVEKSQVDKLRDVLLEVNERPDVEVREFNPSTGMLDEIKKPAPKYRKPGTMSYGTDVPKPGSTGWYTKNEDWLPQWYWELPAISDDAAKGMGATSRASVAPLHYIYHKKGTGILGRLKPAPEREDLPIWTKDEAAAYYRDKGIKMRSRQWIDGHLMQRPGYTDNGQGSGTFVARAASEHYEATHTSVAVPKDIAKKAKEDPTLWETVRAMLGL